MKGKKLLTFNNVVNLTIIILLFISSINLIYYIFAGCKALLNADSCFIVDFAMEQIRTGDFLPKNWIHTNDFWFYSLIPLINVFLRLGISLFLSRQFSVFIQTILLLVVSIKIVKNSFEFKSGIGIILLIIISGVSGQFMFEVFGDATYGSIIFYMLLALYLFINYINKSKIPYIVIFGLLLLILTSCSIRFPIYIAAPLIVSILYLMYDSKIKKEYVISLVVILVATLIGYFINKYLKDVYYLASYSLNHQIVGTSGDLSSAMHTMIFNWLQMNGATNTNVDSLFAITNNEMINTSSPLIVFTFIKFVYAITTLIAPIMLFKNINKLTISERIYLIYTSTLFGLIFFFMLIARMYFWFRYITPVLFMMNFLYVLVYKYYFQDDEKKKIFFKLFIIGISVASLFFVINSYYDIDKKKLRHNDYENITNYLISKDLHYGYVYGDMQHSIYRVLSNDKIQVNRIHYYGRPYFWLNSIDWYSEDYYQGRTFYMKEKDSPSFEFEDKAIEKYEYGKYIIYVFDNHKVILDFLGKIKYEL